MAFGDLDFTASKARFEALGELEQAAQWVSFLDAMDLGGIGYHPHSLHLATLYARGKTPFDGERLADLEPRQVLQGELAFEVYEEELGTPPF